MEPRVRIKRTVQAESTISTACTVSLVWTRVNETTITSLCAYRVPVNSLNLPIIQKLYSYVLLVMHGHYY